MYGDSAIPPYAWIAWQFRDAIRAGVRGLGESMPSESELAELYGVSRMTAGKVLGLLAAEGLIRRRRGSGSVVARQISWEQIPARPGTIISVRLPTASERGRGRRRVRPNTMSLSGFSSIWPRDLVFHVSLEAKRDSGRR